MIPKGCNSNIEKWAYKIADTQTMFVERLVASMIVGIPRFNAL